MRTGGYAVFTSWHPKTPILAIIGCLALLSGSMAKAENWPHFRGVDGSGISQQKGLPTTWSQGDYAWDVAISGIGHGSPIVWGDSVFVTSAEDDGAIRWLICLDAKSGEQRWTRSIGMNRSKPQNLKGSNASSTPATDGERVYVLFADKENFLVAAYDFAGDLVWRRSLGAYESQHGLGVSPIVVEDKLIVCNDQDGPSSIFALDTKTGATRWVTPRAFRGQSTSYATPVVIREPNQPTQLICASGATGISSLDLATGRLNWQSSEFPLRTVASPVHAGGLFIASCGKGGSYGVLQIAVDPRVRDEQGLASVVWKREKMIPYVPTPLVYGDYLFNWSDEGIVVCAEVKTGKDVWVKRLGGKYSGSLLCIDGKIYGVEEGGKVTVIEAGPEFKELGTASLGEDTYSTPAVANGRLYLRTFSRLKCLEAKKG
ncbi:MAG: PQQ-binding-like beta-propeller repeat protein [Planctomycetaceae bacterium]